MKTKSFLIGLCAVTLISGPASAAPAGDKCDAADLRAMRKSQQPLGSFWYVPQTVAKTFFLSADGTETRQYVVAGDALLVAGETAEAVCASYVTKGAVAASGWVAKTAVKKVSVTDFGDAEVQESQKAIAEKVATLRRLAADLPAKPAWRGTWAAVTGDEIKTVSNGTSLKLNPSGIKGVAGTGGDEDDITLAVTGPLAISSEEAGKIDVCDTVAVAFNNALLAVSGSHCMGSGANASWPSMTAVYWRRQ